MLINKVTGLKQNYAHFCVSLLTKDKGMMEKTWTETNVRTDRQVTRNTDREADSDRQAGHGWLPWRAAMPLMTITMRIMILIMTLIQMNVFKSFSELINNIIYILYLHVMYRDTICRNLHAHRVARVLHREAFFLVSRIRQTHSYIPATS